MPSPFPGMDPYVADQEWEDFHAAAINVIRDLIMPEIAPRYIARVERRVYLETEFGEPDSYRVADVAVVADNTERASPSDEAATLTPVECLMYVESERREAYLEIRDRTSKQVITIIELLSPSNKRRGGDGRAAYLTKRNRVLTTATHLVEIDLIRSGERMPMESELPPGDYYAVVSRGYRRPRAEVYPWRLEHPLPSIPIPLQKGDDDVPLDLQNVLDTVYDRAQYGLSIDYNLEPRPPFIPVQAAWVHETLSPRRGQ